MSIVICFCNFKAFENFAWNWYVILLDVNYYQNIDICCGLWNLSRTCRGKTVLNKMITFSGKFKTATSVIFKYNVLVGVGQKRWEGHFFSFDVTCKMSSLTQRAVTSFTRNRTLLWRRHFLCNLSWRHCALVVRGSDAADMNQLTSTGPDSQETIRRQ